MAEVKEAVVPDIGDFTDVPVVEILVSAGDKVEAEAPLVTLESDKASMDVPAPFAGVVEKVLVSVGDEVSEGTPLVAISTDGASGNGQAEIAEKPSAPPPPTKPVEAEGDGKPAAPGGHVYAGPGARKRARELGVDLTRITGTGRKGRILVADVEAGEGAAAPAGGIGDLDLPPWPQVDYAKYGPIERVELPKLKQIAGPNLQRSWITIPHVTHNEEADITELEAFRKRANEHYAKEEKPVKLTMVALLLKACVVSLKEFPDFNSSLDGDSLVLKRYYHLGFAADTPQGLMVPVIRDVDQKDLEEIAVELRELSGKAREGKVGPAEMSGGTFTISSLGGIGGTSFTPIVNPPEVAILGVTRSAMKPVWREDEFVPRLMLPLSLSYDHRVIDGAAAARFCVHLAGVLEEAMKPGFA